MEVKEEVVQANAEYPEYIARFYDTIYSHLRTVDRDYFLRTISATTGPVLEIGVGTGRFFIDALQGGADIYGVDLSESMLRQLRNKLAGEHHHRVLHQDARSLHIDRKFDLILAPFRMFSHLIEPDDQLRVLNSIFDHLNPGGRFIFDLYVPDLDIIRNGIKGQVDFDGEYEPGKKLRRVVSAKSDLIRQVSSVTMKLTWDEETGERTQSWEFPMRYFFRYELEHLVHRSKLTLKHIYGDYEEHELRPDSKDFVVVCAREPRLKVADLWVDA
jgi:SAM-dependent methyltransferase